MRKLIALFALVAGCQNSKPEPILNEVLSPPAKGSWEAPADTIGKKGAPTWTQTTIGAAYQGRQPVEGREITVVGEVLDLSCYWQVGKHGVKHVACAQKCMQNGQPLGLLAKDGTVYVIMDEEHDPRRDGLTKLREWCIERAGWIVEVTGTLTKVGANKAIYIQVLK